MLKVRDSLLTVQCEEFGISLIY